MPILNDLLSADVLFYLVLNQVWLLNNSSCFKYEGTTLDPGLGETELRIFVYKQGHGLYKVLLKHIQEPVVNQNQPSVVGKDMVPGGKQLAGLRHGLSLSHDHQKPFGD